MSAPGPASYPTLSRGRVAVTGATGFLGGHLMAAAETAGLDVVGVGSRDYDLTDAAAVEAFYREVRPDVVIHGAAVVGGIGANAAEPGRFYYANTMMGTLLIEGARRHDLRRFVAIGSVCGYPKHTPVPFAEDHLWYGYPEETNAAYGLAKKMMWVQLDAYRQQYGTRGIFLLPANLYGPGDHFDLERSHVIPAIIRKMARASADGSHEIHLWGDGSPTREFLYAPDAARIILGLADRYTGRDPVNVGVGEEITIRHTVELIAELMDFGGRVHWDTSRPNGQPRRSLSTRRLESILGPMATTDLRSGLAATIRWFREAVLDGRLEL